MKTLLLYAHGAYTCVYSFIFTIYHKYNYYNCKFFLYIYILILFRERVFFLNLSQRNPLLLYITINYKNSFKVIIYYIVGVSF